MAKSRVQACHLLPISWHTGSQALVAFSLQQALPDAKFSMVAEEDSADLRQVKDSMQ